MKLNTQLSKLFQRDLDRLLNELNSYSKEENLWIVKEGISNSAGNLMLHLCGNLKHFIGATLNHTGYVRQRDQEFTEKVSKEELIENIEETKTVVTEYFERVSEIDMSDPFPIEVFGYPMTKSNFIIHLYGHLNYHLGQVNYHRRLIEG